jgi:hypothetical protein
MQEEYEQRLTDEQKNNEEEIMMLQDEMRENEIQHQNIVQ